MRAELPNLKELSSWEKDELIIELWEENVRLRAEHQQLKGRIEELEKQLAAIEEKLNKPPKTSSNSSVAPSQTKKKNRPNERNKKRSKCRARRTRIG